MAHAAPKRDPKKSASDAAPKQSVLTPEAQARRAETCRIRIQTVMLIDRLQDHAMGLIDLSPTQLAAAQALLKKTLPDLSTSKVEIDASPVIFKLGVK